MVTTRENWCLDFKNCTEVGMVHGNQVLTTFFCGSGCGCNSWVAVNWGVTVMLATDRSVPTGGGCHSSTIVVVIVVSFIWRCIYVVGVWVKACPSEVDGSVQSSDDINLVEPVSPLPDVVGAFPSLLLSRVILRLCNYEYTPRWCRILWYVFELNDVFGFHRLVKLENHNKERAGVSRHPGGGSLNETSMV